MTARTLEVHRGRRRGQWFILGLPGPDRRWCGPYDTKSEAMDDARGLAYFFEHLHCPDSPPVHAEAEKRPQPREPSKQRRQCPPAEQQSGWLF